MADMIKFYKGLEASLPASGVNGALYITTDEGAIYLGTGTGMKRLGDFVQVANVAALPEKAHENCLYYCVAENILAKWNGAEWKQVNKQPTVDELKTLLGLGDLAYKSEVAEGDLNADLAAKINASADGNHSHSNKDVLDGITAEKVTAWDAAEKNAKDYADGLNTAMNTRVEALEAIDHEHANKALLDTYTQTEADLADAVAKKHAHTFNETELNKIVEGDVAKWNGVAADHLTSADKTTLENAIKEAKKAGTDANTNIEAYKVTNDARVLAVEEDVAEIVNGENGILAQAKSYSDGKLATARTEITAEIDADVKAVADDLAGYKTSNDAALAGVKATADAAATKEYTDAELAKKVDKVEGKSLVLDTEITKLAGVSEGANKVEASENNGKIKIDGVETTVYTHPAKHQITDIEGLQDALDGKQGSGQFADENHVHTKAQITDFAHTHVASEITDLDATIKAYDYATKTEAQGYADAKDEAIAAAKKTADDITAYVGTFTASEGVDTVVKYIDAKTANIASNDTVGALADRVTQAEKDIDAIEADYLKAADKTELANATTAVSNRVKALEDADFAGKIATAKQEAIDAAAGDATTKADAAENAAKEYAKGYADGLIGSIENGETLSGLVAKEAKAREDADSALQEQITANANAITLLTNGASADEVDGVNDLINYVKEHGTEVTGMQEDIAANTKAIEDEAVRADAAEKALAGRLETLEAIDHDAYKAADAALKTELQAEIDSDVEAAKTELNAAIETAKTEATNQDAVVLSEAQKYADQAKADAIADAAAKYETIGTAQGIVDGLKLSETYEPIGAEGRAIAAAEGKVNELAGKVYTKEEVDAAVEASVTAATTWGSF